MSCFQFYIDHEVFHSFSINAFTELIGPWLFCWEHEELNIVDASDDLILAVDQVNKV